MKKLTRPRDTYSKDYLANRDSIVAYNLEHADEIRIYMRKYMRTYRPNAPRSARVYQGLFRCYLTGRLPTSKRAREWLGCSFDEMVAKHKMSREEFIAFVYQNEIDHIISDKWLRDNHPELRPYCHRHYNLQIISRAENRMKHSWVDADAPAVKHILDLMEAEQLKEAA